VLDHITGEVRFGDGVQGRIPPRAVANIRLARYQTGGGSSGNRAAGTIVQLKTTVPYIDKVRNFEAAEAGVDAEPGDQLLVRGPRTLRNGGRAVTLEDYEDLAHAASPEVERAKTVPLRRLRVDPLGNTEVAGAVSVIIVPRSAAANPLPSSTLLTEVEQYLRGFSTPTAILEVVGPLYVRVDVALEIALSSLEGANAVEQAVRDELNRFLHPLTGGGRTNPICTPRFRPCRAWITSGV
jgi:predicted phage baseplate assembly protein